MTRDAARPGDAQRDARRERSLSARAAALALTLTLGSALGGCASGPTGHDHAARQAGAGAAAAAPVSGVEAPDARRLVNYPAALREHTLANMRDHLAALGEIQAALADGAFDQASDIAERRLGMSSLALHGAHEVAQHMPSGMQDAGTAMHRAASRFALTARDASVSGDLRPALKALAVLNQTCVGCHAAYRLH